MTNVINETTARPERLPNNAFDSEYMTEWVREMRYLADKGIRYTYVKIKAPYGIRQYKYRKTPELFAALLEFYSQVANERSYKKIEKAIEELTAMPDWTKDPPIIVTPKDMTALFTGCEADEADCD